VVDRAQVLTVLGEQAEELLDLRADQIREELSFKDDLDVDSLALVELTMAVEDAFGIELPEDEVKDLRTIGAFVDVILGKANAAPSAAASPA